MVDFAVKFTYPWLLLLLIPALFFALFPYFRTEKKYRRNRNRITSLVLHCIIMVLCVTVLAGMHFTYDKPNIENEIMILVDESESNIERNNDKAQMVTDIIRESHSHFQVGVVLFGFDNNYAASLSNDINKVTSDFKLAHIDDATATDISSAMLYAASAFKKPETAKIVVLSDGFETDGDAMEAVRTLVARGISVNTMHFANNHSNTEVQIVDVTTPPQNARLRETYRLDVTVRSSFSGSATIDMYDYETHIGTQTVSELEVGVQKVSLDCSFALPGLHKLRFEITSDEQGISDNNVYYTYVDINFFNKVLIIQRDDGESDILKSLLAENNYDVTVVDVADAEKMPKTVDDLRKYDEVILMNISRYYDMPEGFENILHSYVYNFGGGVLTSGGDRVDGGKTVANAYDRDYMENTLYQQMLPVQIIDYVPPRGIAIVIDKSGSMSATVGGGQTRLDAAKDGARSIIRNVLTSRDYCAILTLTSDFSVDQNMIPATNRDRLLSIVDSIEMGGGTNYSNALRRAGNLLSALNNVEKRHIILVSDGQPGDKPAEYQQVISDNYNDNRITISIVGIDVSGSDYSNMEEAAKIGGGEFYPVDNSDDIIDKMRDDISSPTITSSDDEPFVPYIRNHTSVVSGVSGPLPQLGGFYGGRVKDGAEVPLSGEYAPVYAEWQYGKGRVGSFMSDLNGKKWSAEFLRDENGRKIISNILYSISPTENIHPQPIDVEFDGENYITNINVFSQFAEGERPVVEISAVLGRSETNEDEYVTELVRKIEPTAEEGYTRMTAVIKDPGVYQITVKKLDAAGETVAEYTDYKALSYSKEYDMFTDSEAGRQWLIDLAAAGNGALLEHAFEVYDDMEEYLHFDVDPTLVLIIIVLVLFLLDLIVRKFKFKWIHELIAEHKERKAKSKD